MKGEKDKVLNKKVGTNDNIKEKLEYLGLDLDNIPNQIKEFEPLKFRVPKVYEEKQYKQYRYVSIKDVQILLSPTNRLDKIEDKYKKASPLSDYLDSSSEENIIKHATFLNMLNEFKIEEVKNIEEEQKNLNKKIPFKVKYESNYLWQIYYSESTDKYFMIVPTEDSDYSTFFYLLKKKLEKRRTGKIFVPIRSVEYSNKYLKKSEFEDIENYLWLFTKDWPLVYEVYDKDDELSIKIIGETEVYDKIRSPYRISLENAAQAKKFYKLLKAMFIMQTELPHYFKFSTNINKNGSIEFFVEGKKLTYTNIADWINEEYDIGNVKQAEISKLIDENKEKLENLKVIAAEQELEYLAKEKQITTFLECKKSFFGKFKYYFKYSKKNNKTKIKQKEDIEKDNNKEIIEEKNKKKKTKAKNKKENYTIEELIDLYKQYEIQENEFKNIIMDINALKLKNKNTKKKIENATLFINEIDKHKKSIFEFWKYSNKDELDALPEGEEEEINIIKKIDKVFDYEEDIEKFGKTMDKMQRKNLSKLETDSIYITTTNLLDILNKVKNNEVTPKDIESNLKEQKKEAVKEKKLESEEEFDIFGGIVKDSTKTSKIDNKTHRELEKDKFNILEITKNTKQIGYKLSLEKTVENIKLALTKNVIPEDISIYKAISGEKISHKNINIFNLNPEKEMKNIVKDDADKINFYKINLKEGMNAVSYTNIIFFDNQNKTLPVGQDLSTSILVDTSDYKLKLKNKKTFKIVDFEDEKNDFSDIDIKSVTVFEYDAETKK